MLFRDEEWRRWSDEELARLAGVSNKFVTKMRHKLQPEAVGRPVLVRRGQQIYLKKPRGATAIQKADGTDYATNWIHYLVRFTPRQFVQWQQIVSGRTDLNVLSKAVETVMKVSWN
jgi:hypothetical protein